MVVQLAGPLALIIAKNRTSRLRQESATADIAVGLTVGNVNDDLMYRPLVRSRPEVPHLKWKPLQGGNKPLVRLTIPFDSLLPFIRAHMAISTDTGKYRHTLTGRLT